MPDDIAAPSAVTPGACRISIGGAPAFEVGRNELLLLAALRQGIDYPHNCRVGTCGSCKTRLLRGRISPMVDFALSPLSNRELQEGYILACQAKVRGDLELEVRLGSQQTIVPRSVSSRVVGWQRLPGEVIDLRLRLDQPLPYRAGQYCTIAESGSFVRRSYSFYDPPPDAAGEGAAEVGFLVKRLPGGRFSEWLFAADRRGVKIWLEGPFGVMGGALGADEHERDSLCVAGGTGLAPILSILGERLERSASSRHTLVFGLRSAQDRFATAALEALQRRAGDRLRVLTILSHEPAGSGWDGPRGLVTDALEGLGLDYGRVAAFVCGSAGMVAAVEARLHGLGVAPERIHADRFIPTS